MKALGLWGMTLLFAAIPLTTNYELPDYSFSSGGIVGSSTTTYSLNGSAGTVAGQGSTTNYAVNGGFIQSTQAAVPTITLDNGSGVYYNKLHFVVSPNGNLTDSTYIIEVTQSSTFTSGINYVQTDGTLSTTFATSDEQSYSTLGSTAGSYIIGLTPATTYYAKVAAIKGQRTESELGPSTPASATTAAASISFSLATCPTQLTCSTTPPFTDSLGTLTAGNVSTATQAIDTTISTNAANGGDVYIGGKNGGLLSSSTGYEIASVSANLTNVSEGFGVQSTSTAQTSGGPLTSVTPYNGTGNVVGIVSPTLSSLYTSTAPVTAGVGIINLLAKSASKDVYATDYKETLTFVVSANF